MNKKNTYTPSQAAKKYGVASSTIINHINSGKLSAKRRLNKFVINENDLTQWAKDQGLED